MKLEYPGEQSKHVVAQMPCGHRVEIKEPRDQYITCGICGKKVLLVWGLKPKIKYEDNKR